MTTTQQTMTGAESLIRTLAACGSDVCFTNPGTTEMHLVHALDAAPNTRSILCLFEGVCTGAADGYGRLAGRPASTLLHLGAGLGNGVACLHNARRARTPIVNLVGNHASFHIQHDAPLTSDIDTLASAFSCWYKSDSTSATLAQDGADAVTAALTANPGSVGQISTLIVGTDAAWGEVSQVAQPNPLPVRPRVSNDRIESVARGLGADSMIILDGAGLSPEGIAAAARVLAKTGCRVVTQFAVSCIDTGPGRPAIDRLPYFPEQVIRALQAVKHIVLAGAQPPVSFFAYRYCPSVLVPDDCQVTTLAHVEEDVVSALQDVADAVDAPAQGATNPKSFVEIPGQGGDPLSIASACAVIANRTPENGIVVADSGSGNNAFGPLQTSQQVTWLSLTGGAIGQGGPSAIGAAIACPDRPVLTMQGDGGGMYTNQSFWTQAREGLNITTVIFSNREYWVLDFEYLRLGLPPLSPKGKSLFSLCNPQLDWVQMAASMGVPGSRVQTIEQFDQALANSFAEPGPYLIEAEIPSPKPQDLRGLIPKQS